MKKLVLLSAVVCCCLAVKAQTVKAEHSIKVIGTAEMEIVPDEIYMSVTLKEFTKDKKKYLIEELEHNLVNYLEKVTMTDKKDVKMDNMSGYILSIKRRNKDEIITKSYNIKFKNTQQVYQLYSVMDSLGISNAHVSKYSHSKMDDYKKEIKIKAITAAKEKACYMLSAIGEKAGKAISVTETNGFVTVNDGTYEDQRENNYSQYRASSFLAGNDYSAASSDKEVIGDKTIKLNYSVQAEFEIQ